MNDMSVGVGFGLACVRVEGSAHVYDEEQAYMVELRRLTIKGQWMARVQVAGESLAHNKLGIVSVSTLKDHSVMRYVVGLKRGLYYHDGNSVKHKLPATLEKHLSVLRLCHVGHSIPGIGRYVTANWFWVVLPLEEEVL